jgi:hypothetical protein
MSVFLFCLLFSSIHLPFIFLVIFCWSFFLFCTFPGEPRFDVNVSVPTHIIEGSSEFITGKVLAKSVPCSSVSQLVKQSVIWLVKRALIPKLSAPTPHVRLDTRKTVYGFHILRNVNNFMHSINIVLMYWCHLAVVIPRLSYSPSLGTGLNAH